MGTFKRFAATVSVIVLGWATPGFANSDLEGILWDLATTSQTIENVEAFIRNFPESEHIDEAVSLRDKILSDQRARTMEDSIFASLGNLTYTTPIAFGDANLIGHSLSEIAELTPAFPPVEGLPDEVWKDKTCNSCHQWNQERLCAQANTYVSKDPEKYREKKHPFGGLLKINLRNWAMNGCQ